jgi:tetratricopeptide (TPR) repeat protein
LVLVLWLASSPVAAQDRDQDRDRAAASQAIAEGARLWKEETEESRLRAIYKYQEALALYRASGDRSEEVATIVRIGSSYNKIGNSRKAIECWEQALPLYRALGERGREGLLLVSIGNVYKFLNENERALDRFKQAAPVQPARQSHDLSGGHPGGGTGMQFRDPHQQD